METLFYLLIIFLIGIVVWILILLSTRTRREPAELACLGAVTEPEARLWVDRLRSVGIWADFRHVGGVSVLTIELGSLRGYEVWVRADELGEAQQVLGLE